MTNKSCHQSRQFFVSNVWEKNVIINRNKKKHWKRENFEFEIKIGKKKWKKKHWRSLSYLGINFQFWSTYCGPYVYAQVFNCHSCRIDYSEWEFLRRIHIQKWLCFLCVYVRALINFEKRMYDLFLSISRQRVCTYVSKKYGHMNLVFGYWCWMSNRGKG